MTKDQVINSPYLVPAILANIDGNTSKPIMDILEFYNIGDTSNYKSLYNFLNYNFNIVKSDFNPDYELLRLGLTEYFNVFLKDFWPTIGIIESKDILLDYASGSGIYSSSYLEHNPEGKTICIDKSTGDKVDFMQSPSWYIKYEKSIDIVLLSEILHCKDLTTRTYLINSSIDMLRFGGKIIINENKDPFMDWRLSMLTNHGTGLSISDIITFMSNFNNLVIKDIKILNSHTIYIYEKI